MQTIATIFAILIALFVVAVIVFAIVLWNSIQPRDGDALAAERVEHVAGALADDLSHMREPLDAETVAAEWFHSSSATVEPLTWTGTVDDGRTATIEARVSAMVPESSTGGFFARHTSAGSAVGCYRYTVGLGEDARYEAISCDDLPASEAPPSSNRPTFSDDAAERIEEILESSHGDDLEDALRAEFSGAEYTIDTEKTDDGQLVAAVGLDPGTKCILRVKTADGEIISPSYDRIWLEPGELGCTTRLYTAPPV